MAAPKALRSPGSAGRPANVSPPVPQGQDIPDITGGDLPDIAGGDVPEAPQAAKGLEMASEFGSPAEAEAAAQAMIPSRETVADVGAALATQVPARLAAGIPATAAGGPLAGYLAQQAAGAGAAFFEKDVANLFRKALGAPENQERDRATDVAMSFLFDIPGAGIAATQAIDVGLQKIAQSSVKNAVKMLPIDQQSALVALRSSIEKEMGQFVPAEEAAKQVANLEKDFIGLVGQGYSPKQAGIAVTKKYSFQVRANQAKNDLLESVGPEIGVSGFEKISAMPNRIIELKRARAGNQQKIAFEAVRQTKGLDQIDTSALVAELNVALKEAQGVGDRALSKNISDIIDGISERSKLKTQFNNMAAFSEATGGKPPQYVDMKTGTVYKAPSGITPRDEISTPFPETQEFFEVSGKEPVYVATGRAGTLPPPSGRPFEGSENLTWQTERFDRPGVKIGDRETAYPGSEQMGLSLRGPQIPLTPEEQAARMLPPKLADANENFVMQSIDSLIQKRMSLDARIPEITNEEKKLAFTRAVTALRGIEDQFMMNLRNKGGRYAEISDKYMSAKNSYHQIKDAMESMGSLVKEDAVGVARMLDASTPQQIEAWSSVMPKDVKNSVARRYVEGILDMSAGMPDRPYTKEQFARVQQALSDSYKENKLGKLLGSQRAKEISADIGNLSKLVQAASTLPASAGPESQVIRKLFQSLERLTKNNYLNFFYSGRMAFDPETRAYRDFLNYIMGKDFSAAMASISDPMDIASAGAELTRVFGSNHPNTKRFYNFIQSSGMLPYAASAAGQVTRAANQ